MKDENKPIIGNEHDLILRSEVLPAVHRAINVLFHSNPYVPVGTYKFKVDILKRIVNAYADAELEAHEKAFYIPPKS